MSIFSAIFTIWLLLVFVLSFYSTKWSIALFVAYSILVPSVQLQLGPITLGSLVIYILQFAMFLLKYKDDLKFLDLRRFYPFAFLLLAQGFLIMFQTGVPVSYAIEQFLRDIAAIIMYPLAIYTLVIFEIDSWALLKRTLLICGVIFTAYGLFLTTMPGVNPYLILTLPIFGQEFNEAYALGYSALSTTYDSSVADGRLFGRISSVFSHPMNYGLNLGFISFFLTQQLKSKPILLTTCLIVLSTAIFTSGVRTPIAAITFTILALLLYLRNFKYAFYGTLIGFCIISILLFLFPNIEEYMLSMISSNSATVNGSSISMRISQLEGCFDIIKNHIFEGLGYRWTTFYNSTEGSHPVLLSFESLLFVILCNQGILGIIIWTIFILWVVYDIRTIISKEVQIILLGIFIYYLAFSFITGEYGYMKYMMLYYIIAIGFCYDSLGDDENVDDENITIAPEIYQELSYDEQDIPK